MTRKSIVPSQWEMPQVFRDRLGDEAGRQRAMFAENHLLLVLHSPPKPEEVKRQGRFFWRQPDGTWTSNDLGSGAGALGKHLAEFADLLEKYDRKEEAATSAEEYFHILEALQPLHRLVRHLHETLQEARTLVPEDRDLINHRDRAYEVERTVELLHNEVKNSLDLLVARQAEEQAEAGNRIAIAGHRLNILAAFFLPLATLSALFGTNLKHGFEEMEAPRAFSVLMLAGLAAGILLTFFVIRKPRRKIIPKPGAKPRR